MFCTVLRIFFILYFARVSVGFTTSLSRYVGCFEVVDSTGAHIWFSSQTTAGEGTSFSLDECVHYCNYQAEAYAQYTYMGLSARGQCYCLEEINQLTVKYFKPIPGGTCNGTNSVKVGTTCPSGYFQPPFCQGKCLPSCMQMGDLSVCTYNGTCSYGCVNNWCGGGYLCQSLSGDVNNQPRFETFLLEFPPQFFLFHGMSFQYGGYITKAHFIAHGTGYAYVGVWRKVVGSRDIWMLVGKFTIESSYGNIESGLIVYNVPTEEQVRVEIGDVVGIHYDHIYVNSLSQSDRINHTILRFTSNPDNGATAFGTVDTLDYNWGLETQIKVPVNTTSVLSPSLQLFVQCACPQTCAEGVCQTDGKCVHCNPGWMGQRCDISCTSKTYGPDCAQQCPAACYNQECDRFTGACVRGCEIGYEGNFCRPCSNYRWGPNCGNVCSGRCCGNVSCHHITGLCPSGCAGQFEPPMCTSCTSHYYGLNCSQRCGRCMDDATCNRVSGYCPSMCVAGYVSPMCVDSCPYFTYGLNCSNTCGHCNKSYPCHPVTGVCTNGCLNYYLQPLCRYCPTGYFGLSCEFVCGKCKDRVPCHPVTGACPRGCDYPFEGPQCKNVSDLGLVDYPANLVDGPVTAAKQVLIIPGSVNKDLSPPLKLSQISNTASITKLHLRRCSIACYILCALYG